MAGAAAVLLRRARSRLAARGGACDGAALLRRAGVLADTLTERACHDSGEVSIYHGQAVVYELKYNGAAWDWSSLADGGWAELHVFHEATDAVGLFRMVAWIPLSNEVILNANVTAATEWAIVSPDFYQFTDEGGTAFGLAFSGEKEALTASAVIEDALSKLKGGASGGGSSLPAGAVATAGAGSLYGSSSSSTASTAAAATTEPAAASEPAPSVGATAVASVGGVGGGGAAATATVEAVVEEALPPLDSEEVGGWLTGQGVGDLIPQFAKARIVSLHNAARLTADELRQMGVPEDYVAYVSSSIEELVGLGWGAELAASGAGSGAYFPPAAGGGGAAAFAPPPAEPPAGGFGDAAVAPAGGAADGMHGGGGGGGGEGGSGGGEGGAGAVISEEGIPVGPDGRMRGASAADVGEHDDGVSLPFDVMRGLHITFDMENARYEGLPAEWSELNVQFGISLDKVPRRAVEGYVSTIPAVLVMMQNYLYNNGGLEVEGIFRLAPDKDECSVVKKAINSGSFTDCSDVNCISNLIKVWFRELPPNLLNCIEEEVLLRVCDMDASLIPGEIAKFPEPNQSLFLWLLDLMAEVVKKEPINKMTAKNMAIVLSPNLYCISSENPMAALTLSQKIAQFTYVTLKSRLAAHHGLIVE